jgi:hypothetical protein
LKDSTHQHDTPIEPRDLGVFRRGNTHKGSRAKKYAAIELKRSDDATTPAAVMAETISFNLLSGKGLAST